jgi:hypothetical protein
LQAAPVARISLAMVVSSIFVAAALSTFGSAYVWPNPQLDALEHYRFDQYGYNADDNAIPGGVTPCTSTFVFDDTPGRSNAADWIRNVSVLLS